MEGEIAQVTEIYLPKMEQREIQRTCNMKKSGMVHDIQRTYSSEYSSSPSNEFSIKLSLGQKASYFWRYSLHLKKSLGEHHGE